MSWALSKTLLADHTDHDKPDTQKQFSTTAALLTFALADYHQSGSRCNPHEKAQPEEYIASIQTIEDAAML